AVHRPDLRAERVVAMGTLDGGGDSGDVECLRGAVIHLSAVGDEPEDDALGFGSVGGSEDLNCVRLERGRRSLHACLLSRPPEPAVDRGFGVRLELSDHLAFLLDRYTCNSNYLAKAAFIAYATTFRTRCRRPPRPARGPGAPRPARVRRLAGPAQGARHAPASARH